MTRSSGALDRARADASAGDYRAARRRLQSYLVNRPDSLDARLMLVELYRQEGHLDEAGRWGYLIGGAATEAERRAFEHRGVRWAGVNLVLLQLRKTLPVVDPSGYGQLEFTRLTELQAWRARFGHRSDRHRLPDLRRRWRRLRAHGPRLRGPGWLGDECPSCHHMWSEHPGAAVTLGEVCSECTYEIEHEQSPHGVDPCRQLAGIPAWADWSRP